MSVIRNFHIYLDCAKKRLIDPNFKYDKKSKCSLKRHNKLKIRLGTPTPFQNEFLRRVYLAKKINRIAHLVRKCATSIGGAKGYYIITDNNVWFHKYHLNISKLKEKMSVMRNFHIFLDCAKKKLINQKFKYDKKSKCSF